jgi:RNase P/RNase MRP subunit p29
MSPTGRVPESNLIEVDSFVVVRGDRTEEALQADLVLVLADKPDILRGQVVSIGANTFVMARDDEELTVITDESTRYRLPGIETQGLESLQEGEAILVSGTFLEEDGDILARLISRPRQRIGRIEGDVIAVEDVSLTLERRRGDEVTLGIMDNTVFVVPGVPTPTSDSVNVGDHVHARIVVEDEGQAAQYVKVIPPDAATLVGEVVEVNTADLVIQTRLEQEIVIEVEETTRLVVPGLENPTLSDVWNGDRVRISGAWQTEDRFLAWEIGVVAEDRLKRTQGRVLALEDDVLTLGTTDGTLTVRVDEETRYQIPDVDAPAFANLEIGQRIAVRGLWQEAGDLLAREIRSIH